MAVWTEDTERGQVRVEIGTGLIKDLKHEAGKRNAQLVINATHANLRQPVTGWVDTADGGVWPVAQQAHTEHFEVEYRIEVHRKNNVDLGTPIAKLQSGDKVRDVVALARKGELSQIDKEPPAEASTGDDTAEPDTAQPTTQPEPQRRRPRVEENKPWELYNTDRSLNLASYSYQAAAEMVELAHRLITQHDNEPRDDNQPAPEFSMRRVANLARTLLEAADEVQAATRGDGRVDRMDNSHRRARYAVITALQQRPIPWDATGNARGEWQKQLTAHAAEILAAAFGLFQFHETGAPR